MNDTMQVVWIIIGASVFWYLLYAVSVWDCRHLSPLDFIRLTSPDPMYGYQQEDEPLLDETGKPIPNPYMFVETDDAFRRRISEARKQRWPQTRRPGREK